MRLCRKTTVLLRFLAFDVIWCVELWQTSMQQYAYSVYAINCRHAATLHTHRHTRSTAYTLIRTKPICMRTKETKIEQTKVMNFIRRVCIHSRGRVVFVCVRAIRELVCTLSIRWWSFRVRFLCGFFSVDVVVGYTNTHMQASAKKTCNSCLNIFVLGAL